MSSTSRSCVVRNGPKCLVLAKIANEATEIAK
jgi:hypothetical protein